MLCTFIPTQFAIAPLPRAAVRQKPRTLRCRERFGFIIHRPMIRRAGKIRFDEQTADSPMIATVIILSLLTLLVATDPN